MPHKIPDPTYKVLIVDDDPFIRRLISSILTLKGHQCEEANDGMEALEKFSKTSFDAVITDIRMPRMDGIDLTRELLKLQPALPIIVMTGYHDISIAEEAILARAGAFLNKPFSLMDLLTRFTKVMLNHRKL
jgi:DNA-binding NtrC family response regulator